MDVVLKVNGAKYRLNLDPRVSLLDALRETLALTGTKKGCDQGQCGACTVLVDGVRVLSCFCLAATVDGEVTTAGAEMMSDTAAAQVHRGLSEPGSGQR